MTALLTRLREALGSGRRSLRVYMAQAREALGAARTEAAIRAGRDMSFEDAVGEARAAAGRYDRAAAR